MATCPPSFSMWYEDDHDPQLLLPQEKRGQDHALVPCFVPSRRDGVAMATPLTCSGVEGQWSWLQGLAFGIGV